MIKDPNCFVWNTKISQHFDFVVRFADFDGKLLLGCKALKEAAPEVFATSILKQFTFKDLIRLNEALSELR